LLTAALFATVAPTRALASGLPTGYYELKNNGSSTYTSIVVADVSPANAIQPHNATVSPLTVSSASTGLNPSNVQVALSPPSPTSQQIALDIVSGLQANSGNLIFQLDLAPSYSAGGQPTLTLTPSEISAGLSLSAYNPPPAVNGQTTTTIPAITTNNTPEPISLALWSTLMAAGALRARAHRRGRAIQTSNV
jgi:hypothetical protein